MRTVLDIALTILTFACIVFVMLLIVVYLTGCSITIYECTQSEHNKCKEERHEEIKGWYWGENDGVIRTKENVSIQDIKAILEHIESECWFMLEHWLGESYENYLRLRAYVDSEFD